MHLFFVVNRYSCVRERTDEVSRMFDYVYYSCNITCMGFYTHMNRSVHSE